MASYCADCSRGIRRWIFSAGRNIGAQGEDDPIVLQWAALQGRVVLTHDFETMIGFAYDRIEAGLPMQGIIAVNSDIPIRSAIDDLLLIAEASADEELSGQIVYLPL